MSAVTSNKGPPLVLWTCAESVCQSQGLPHFCQGFQPPWNYLWLAAFWRCMLSLKMNCLSLWHLDKALSYPGLLLSLTPSRRTKHVLSPESWWGPCLFLYINNYLSVQTKTKMKNKQKICKLLWPSNIIHAMYSKPHLISYQEVKLFAHL